MANRPRGVGVNGAPTTMATRRTRRPCLSTSSRREPTWTTSRQVVLLSPVVGVDPAGCPVQARRQPHAHPAAAGSLARGQPSSAAASAGATLAVGGPPGSAYTGAWPIAARATLATAPAGRRGRRWPPHRTSWRPQQERSPAPRRASEQPSPADHAQASPWRDRRVLAARARGCAAEWFSKARAGQTRPSL